MDRQQAERLIEVLEEINGCLKPPYNAELNNLSELVMQMVELNQNVDRVAVSLACVVANLEDRLK